MCVCVRVCVCVCGIYLCVFVCFYNISACYQVELNSNKLDLSSRGLLHQKVGSIETKLSCFLFKYRLQQWEILPMEFLALGPLG